MNARIFVCVTCNRYAPTQGGEPTPGEVLAAAMRRCGTAVAIRTVECLNACPHPCAAALRVPGKTVIRFSELTADDAPALLETAVEYAESGDGDIPIPVSLQRKVSDRVSVGAA